MALLFNSGLSMFTDYLTVNDTLQINCHKPVVVVVVVKLQLH